MNYINFNQSVGFPLETEILAEMQKAYKLLNALGAIVGNNTIIKGCELVGTNVADGVVYIDGEILEFKGGTVDTNIIIVEAKTALEFEDTITRDVIYTRYATFGAATTQWAWAGFKRGFPTVDIETALASKASAQDLTTLSNSFNTMAAKLNTIAQGANVNVKADWNASTGDAEILNKPNIGSSFLRKGIFSIGDVTTNDNIRTVNFSSVGTDQYFVVGCLRSISGNWNADNDVIWTIQNPTATTFNLLLRELSSEVQNLEFHYALIPF